MDQRSVAVLDLFDFDQATQDAAGILATLVGFDTTSHKSNLALIDWAQEHLTDLGARCVRIPDDTGQKSNLHVIIGPDVSGGVVLSGHTDVVPVDGQPWTSDPFVLTRKGDKLFGRGSCDMKGFLACAIAHAPSFARAHAERRLKKPVHFALSYDEEVGCFGAPRMIEAIAAGDSPPDRVIIGEPTEMKVVSAHKGIRSYDITITGRPAPSSTVGVGVSANHVAVEVLNHLMAERDALVAAAHPDSPFDPAHATLTVGLIHGGTTHNILAGSCEIGFDFRVTPWDDPEALEDRLEKKLKTLEAQMQTIAPEAKINLHYQSSIPAMKPEADGRAEQLARAITGDNAMRVAAYAAEGGQFQEGGFSTVICGPGSIHQAHQPDEFVAIDQLTQCMEFMKKLEAHLCQS